MYPHSVPLHARVNTPFGPGRYWGATDNGPDYPAGPEVWIAFDARPADVPDGRWIPFHFEPGGAALLDPLTVEDAIYQDARESWESYRALVRSLVLRKDRRALDLLAEITMEGDPEWEALRAWARSKMPREADPERIYQDL